MLFAILLTVTVLSIAVWKIAGLIAQPLSFSKTAPAPINEAKILTGGEFFTKKELFKQKEISFKDMILSAGAETDEARKQIAMNAQIAKMAQGYSDISFNSTTGETTLLGKFGVQTIDRDGNLKNEFYLEPNVTVLKVFGLEQKQYTQEFDDYRIVDIENDGQPEFLAWGSISGIALFDSTGKKIFGLYNRDISVDKLFDEKEREKEFERVPLVNAAAAGDLDGDGTKEIVFTTSKDEIIAIDRTGKEIWKYGGQTGGDRLAMIDLDGDLRSEIIETGYSSPKIRASDGTVNKEFDVGNEYDSEIYNAGDEKKRDLRFAGIAVGTIKIFNEVNVEVFSAEAPLSKFKIDGPRVKHSPFVSNTGETFEIPDDDGTSESYGLQMAFAGLKKNEEPYIAAASGFPMYDRANFYLYSTDGKLIYHELLPEETREIITVRNENGLDDIIVLGKTTVWRYSVK